GDLTQVIHREALLAQPAARASKNTEVLHRFRMPVLETTPGQSPPLEFPAASDRFHGGAGAPAAFGQSIQCEIATIAGSDICQLFDLEVLGSLLELHVRARHPITPYS